MRTVHVTLTFECEVEDTGKDKVDPKLVGQNLCRLIQTPGQIGNPNWIATPRAVRFITATEI